MAANPLGAHQVGRGFADCATAHVVAIIGGVPRVGAVRHACFKPEFTLMADLDFRIGLRDREPTAIISERAGTATGILDFHHT